MLLSMNGLVIELKVYLSGPIDFSSEKALNICRHWRIHAHNLLIPHEIETVNPMRGDAHLNPAQDFDDMEYQRSLVMRDMNDIDKCDIILCFFPPSIEKRGIGTLMEMMYAFMLKKPVILIDPEARISEHPWVKHTITEKAKTLPLAIDRIVGYWHA